MTPENYVNLLRSSKEFFDRATKCLGEEDSEFAPTDDSFTTAQQVAHVAQTIDWFIAGGFGSGFTMDFEQAVADTKKVKSLKEARATLEKAYASAIDTVGSKKIEQLQETLPEGPFMGGAPRHAVVEGIVEHTAHHRGALSVYTRLRGHVPPIPYMDT